MRPVIRGSFRPRTLLALKVITEPLPPTVSIKLGNLIYVEKKDLPDVFLDRLIRLAAFQNPEFYKTQAMRLSTFGKPRVIGCAEDLPHHIALPRGLLQEVLDLFQSHRIEVEVTDHRFSGVPIQVDFHGDRRANQTEAAKALALARRRNPLRSDSIWKDCRCCSADRDAQSEHPGVSSSPSSNGSMAGATGVVPRS